MKKCNDVSAKKCKLQYLYFSYINAHLKHNAKPFLYPINFLGTGLRVQGGGLDLMAHLELRDQRALLGFESKPFGLIGKRLSTSYHCL